MATFPQKKTDGEEKGLVWRILYALRDLHSWRLFKALRQHAQGKVLDVGGGRFFATAKARGVPHTAWFSVDPFWERAFCFPEPEYRVLCGDGCNLPCRDNEFDTVLCIQVLEHVYEPLAMVREISRTLKKGGVAVFLIPQTGVTHSAPYYYYNFSRFWIGNAMRDAKLQLVAHTPIGGVWSSMASHLLHFFLQAFRFPGTSTKSIRRPLWFYPLFPLMAVYAIVNIPICLLFSRGDLHEEPNNHLVVVRKD